MSVAGPGLSGTNGGRLFQARYIKHRSAPDLALLSLLLPPNGIELLEKHHAVARSIGGILLQQLANDLVEFVGDFGNELARLVEQRKAMLLEEIDDGLSLERVSAGEQRCKGQRRVNTNRCVW